MNAFEQAFAKLDGGRVLDVATGQGGFVHALIELLPSYQEIVGIDSRAQCVEAAEAAFEQENVHFVQMDAAEMDFEDGSFDVACISNSLHHMDDLPRVLAEMQRVIKPGGHLVISEMYRDGQTEPQLTHVQMHHWWGVIDTALGVTHRETYTRQEIVDLVQGLGLSSLECYDYAELESDPLDPQMVERLEAATKMYMQRAENLPDQQALQQRGEELLQRLRQVGFQGATHLIVVGQK